MTGQIHHRGTVDYALLHGLHYSDLKEFELSPKHFDYRRRHPRRQSSSMRLGDATHVAVLEPGRFLTDFVLMPESWPGKATKATRSGKAWEEFRAANAGKRIIGRSDYDKAIAISESVRADQTAMKYLGFGRAEIAITWTDDETGLELCGRSDWVTEVRGKPYLVDLKGTRSVVPFHFQRDCAKYSYHIQASMYVDGYASATGTVPGFAIVAAEFEEPHDVVVYLVEDDVLQIGRDQYRGWLERYVQCTEDGRWPGISNGFEKTLILPSWAVPDDDADGDDLGLKGF